VTVPLKQLATRLRRVILFPLLGAVIVFGFPATALAADTAPQVQCAGGTNGGSTALPQTVNFGNCATSSSNTVVLLFITPDRTVDPVSGVTMNATGYSQAMTKGYSGFGNWGSLSVYYKTNVPSTAVGGTSFVVAGDTTNRLWVSWGYVIDSTASASIV